MAFRKSRRLRKSKKERRNKHKKTRRMYSGGQSIASSNFSSINPIGISPFHNLF